MKNLLTILALFTLIHSLSFAQCTVPGGDFEDIQDISSQLMEDGDFDFCSDTTIIGSPHFISFTRFLTLSFEILFGGIFGENPEVNCQELFGIDQHPGANGTSTALKLQPDTLINIADAFTIFPCDSLPTALKGSYLHVGSDLDTARVLITVNYDFYYETADGVGLLNIAGGSNEFTEFEVPIVTENQVTVDSIIIVLLAQSDTTFLAEGKESYYVFDELELVYENIDTMTSVLNLEIFEQLNISPNPAIDLVQISLSDHPIQHIKVYNENGVLILEQNKVHDFSSKLDVSQLPDGLYVIEVTGEGFTLTKKLIKL